MSKYIIITVVVGIFGTLIATKDVDATSGIPSPRAENVSQTVTTRESFEGNVPCHDEMQIVDRELPHGEQINAYPKTVCK